MSPPFRPEFAIGHTPIILVDRAKFMQGITRCQPCQRVYLSKRSSAKRQLEPNDAEFIDSALIRIKQALDITCLRPHQREYLLAKRKELEEWQLSLTKSSK